MKIVIDLDIANEMHDGGLSYKRIASVLCVSASTLQRAMNPEQAEKNRVANAARHERMKGDQEYLDHRRKYSLEYKEEHIEAYLAYREEHREENNARCSEYKKENRAYCAAKSAERRALIMGATIGRLEDIQEIYRQAREDEPIRCYLCGKLIPLGDRHVDHVFPLSQGGDHCASNLKIAHSLCNLQKSSKVLQEEM